MILMMARQEHTFEAAASKTDKNAPARRGSGCINRNKPPPSDFLVLCLTWYLVNFVCITWYPVKFMSKHNELHRNNSHVQVTSGTRREQTVTSHLRPQRP